MRRARTKTKIPAALLDTAATIMRALGHPLRLRILELLEGAGEANVSRICAATRAAQPTVSQQLARMRMLGVLATRRRGNRVFYRVARPEVLGVLDCIREMGD